MAANAQYQRPINNLFMSIPFYYSFHFWQVWPWNSQGRWWTRSRSHGGWWNRRVSWMTFGTTVVQLVSAMGWCGMRCRHCIVMNCHCGSMTMAQKNTKDTMDSKRMSEVRWIMMNYDELWWIQINWDELLMNYCWTTDVRFALDLSSPLAPLSIASFAGPGPAQAPPRQVGLVATKNDRESDQFALFPSGSIWFYCIVYSL